MENKEGIIIKWATTVNNFYTLWSLVALYIEELPTPDELALKYNQFMTKVSSMTDEVDPKSLSFHQDKLAYTYYTNSRGASTDFKQRNERLNALKKAILNYESN